MPLTPLTADDRLSIQELYTRYSVAEEAADVDHVLTLFTEDCSIENSAMLFQGKEQIRNLTRGLSVILKKHNARHVHFSLIITAEDAVQVRSQGSFFIVSYQD